MHHTTIEKSKSIWETATEFPGVQTLFLLVLDLSLRGVVPLTFIPRLLSEEPLRLFGLWPLKRGVHIWASGDLVIVDPNKEFILTIDRLEYK